MKILMIEALTEKGADALEQNWKESQKLSMYQKAIFKTSGFKQELVKINPFTLQLSINNRHADEPLYIDLVIKEIHMGLMKNGADKGTDYIISLVNE